MNPAGRIVLVTGASSGIGRETALEFARRHAIVVAVARREERLDELVVQMNRLSASSCSIAGDLADPDFARGLVPEILERHGRIDIVVNNAATPKHQSILDVEPAEIERVLRVNFLSAAWITRAALSAMRAQGEGIIVNVSSVAARVTPPREGLYAASKAALESFTEGLWTDLAGSGIHAGLVVPGAIDTEIWDKLDSPSAFQGRRHPVSVVVRAILEVVERRRFEVHVPRWTAGPTVAALLRRAAPGLLRWAMARFEPPPTSLEDPPPPGPERDA